MTIAKEFDIAGKVFVVVGAGRGIGRGIMEVFSEAGCSGIAVARTPTYVIPAAERAKKKTGQRVIGIAADATKTSDMDTVFKTALTEFGKVDIWVNAAGDHVMAPLVPLPKPDGSVNPAEWMSDEEFWKILNLNLVSIHAGCRAVGAYFLAQRRGRVINVGSVLGRFSRSEASTYCAAKAGVEALTRSVALEWAPYGVTVNCIAPGSIPDLEFLSSEEIEERRKSASQTVPLQRYGTVRELGLYAAFLASDAASYITGQTLYMDGGRTAGGRV